MYGIDITQAIYLSAEGLSGTGKVFFEPQHLLSYLRTPFPELYSESECESVSQYYVTTEGQSASLSSNKAPI
jgi:hypothetical protein